MNAVGLDGCLLIFFLWSHILTEIRVLEADMLDLPFGNECFDVVIEKGTMVILNTCWSPDFYLTEVLCTCVFCYMCH